LSTYSLAVIGLIFTTFIWGVTFELVKNSLNEATPFIFSSIRFFIAFSLTFLLVSIKSKKIKITKDEFIAGIICAIFLFLGYSFQTTGLWEGLEGFGSNDFFGPSDPNKSAFITGTSVLMVPVIMLFIGQTNKSIHLWISILIVLIGLVILLDPNVEKFTIGDMLTFGCSLSFAIHIIFQGKYVTQGFNIYNFFLVQTGIVTVLFLIMAIFEYQFMGGFINSNIIVLKGLLITGVLATFIAILIMVWAQKIVSPIQTAMIFTLEPVFAGLYNHFFTNYPLTDWGKFSGLIIVLGIMYHEYKVNKA